ncbi:glutamine cyclotransferase [Thiocystis violacea]|nr:glutamine cyclotransferase [Thiocystis violacea]
MLLLGLLGLGGAYADEASPPSAPVLGYRLVASYPHDSGAFTQGLIHVDGRLYEGTGNYGASVLRRVDLTSGRVERETRLPSRLFGEGITQWRGRLVQLTWRERLGLIYDAETLKPQEAFRYEGEGWGLTHDERHWIMSDGSAVLRFLDPDSKEVVRRLTVLDGARPIDRLNELEYINGEIWANVWKRDHLVRISPETGAVIAYVDLAGLYPAAERPSQEAVLNGIAHDAASGRLFVTGKYWPRLYEIEVLPKSDP